MLAIQPATLPVAVPSRTRQNANVTSDDLKGDQKARLVRQVERQVNFVTKLCDRMTALGFPPDDPLAAAAATARLKLHALYRAARLIGTNRK